MKYLSEKEFNAKMKCIQRENETKERLNQLKAERNKLKPKKKKMSNSKLVLWAIVALVFAITIWFMYESHRLCDLSQAYALLGVVATLAPVVWAYYSKSKAENTSGGIIYETAMMENLQSEQDIEGEG